jgi:hypothetical protein
MECSIEWRCHWPNLTKNTIIMTCSNLPHGKDSEIPKDRAPQQTFSSRFDPCLIR